MEQAFAAGYDPSLELAKSHFPARSGSDGDTADDVDYELPWTEHLRRKEQDTVDHIIHGNEHGHYFMLLGPKVSARFQILRFQYFKFFFQLRVLVKVQ